MCSPRKPSTETGSCPIGCTGITSYGWKAFETLAGKWLPEIWLAETLLQRDFSMQMLTGIST
jgi:hypothetical protein